MENPFEDFDFQEFIEGDINIAGRKVPKIAIIGGGVVLIVLLVVMGKRSGGTQTASFGGAAKSNNEPSEDGTGAIDGSSSDILAGVQQQISDSESKTASDLATQITDTQSQLEASFNSQLQGVLDSLSAYQPFSPEPSYLPVDSGFYGQQVSEPSYYDYAGIGGYSAPSLDAYSSNSPIAPSKNVRNVNKALTSAPTTNTPTVKPSLGTVSNFGSIGASAISKQIAKATAKPQPIKPSATVATKPGTSILSGALSSFITPKPTVNAKPVTSNSNSGIAKLPIIGNIFGSSKPISVPKPVSTVKPIVPITRPPPVYNPRPVAPPPPKPVSLGGSLLGGGAKKPVIKSSGANKPNR